MTYPVFPAIDPGQWSTKFPIRKTPLFSTIIQTPASGKNELRIPLYAIPRWQFDVDMSYAKGNPNDRSTAIGEIIGFFVDMQGAAGTFLYDDIFDDEVPATAPALFGVGDGVTQAFRIGNGLQVFQGSYPQIYVDGTPIGSGYSIVNGLVTFGSPPHGPSAGPPAIPGAQITWSGKYYYLCRFLEDQWSNMQQDFPAIWSNSSLKFITVII